MIVPTQAGVYFFGCMDPTQDLHIPKLVSLVTNRDVVCGLVPLVLLVPRCRCASGVVVPLVSLD